MSPRALFQRDHRDHSAHLPLVHPLDAACMLGLYSREQSCTRPLEVAKMQTEADIITSFANNYDSFQ